MKKQLFVAAILTSALRVFVFANAATAQSSGIQIGGEVGIAIASLTGGERSDLDSRSAPYGGASLVFHKKDARFGFQTGLMLVPKGAASADIGNTATFELNYVDVPLLLRIAFPLRESNIVPTLLLGGSVAAKQSCKVTGSSGTTSASIDCDDSVFEGDLDVKTVDVNVAGGLEVGIPIGARFMLAPTIRFTRGMININGASDNEQTKNSAIQGGVGFRIKL